MIQYLVRFKEVIRMNLFVRREQETVATLDLRALLKRNADRAVDQRMANLAGARHA